ncbi:MFS transporter [Dactylosporangium sp. NPDC000521]|uniref:MFS transporter n=1 Tax=Dactylosporangium sp. NPDC000521 TaxID=3363975 RepID=UPI0036BFEBDF
MTDTTGAPGATARRERRNFNLFWAGDTLGQFGYSVGLFLFPLLAATNLHATPAEIGLVTAAGTFAFIVLSLPVGVMVDRLPKRPVLFGANAGRTVALVAGWAVSLDPRTGMVPLYIAALGVGCCSVAFDIAYQSYPPSLVDPDQYTLANSRLQSSAQVAQVSGPTLAGLLAATLHGASALLATAALYAGSAGVIGRVREVRTAPPPPRRRIGRELADGVAFVVRQPWLRSVTTSTALWNLSASAATPALILLLTDVNGLTSGQAGALLSSGGVGGVLGAVVARRLTSRLGERVAVWAPLLLTAPFAFLLPWIAGGLWLVVFCVANLVLWAGAAAYNVAQVSRRVKLCPPELLGRMNASIRFFVSGTLPIGAVAGGVLAGVLGVPGTLLLCAVLRVVAAVPLLIEHAHHRTRAAAGTTVPPAAPPPRDATAAPTRDTTPGLRGDASGERVRP